MNVLVGILIAVVSSGLGLFTGCLISARRRRAAEKRAEIMGKLFDALVSVTQKGTSVIEKDTEGVRG